MQHLGLVDVSVDFRFGCNLFLFLFGRGATAGECCDCADLNVAYVSMSKSAKESFFPVKFSLRNWLTSVSEKQHIEPIKGTYLQMPFVLRAFLSTLFISDSVHIKTHAEFSPIHCTLICFPFD